jgi:cbb3-type cytochrome oxidase subunit 3
VIFLICVLVFLLRERRADISHYRQREAMFTAFTIALVVGFIKVVAPQVVIDNEIVRQAENIEDTPSP